MAKWQLREAKTHLSELIEEAHRDGPQVIAVDGVERAVVLSMEKYRELTEQEPDLLEYLLDGPKFDDFEIDRDRNSGRESAL